VVRNCTMFIHRGAGAGTGPLDFSWFSLGDRDCGLIHGVDSNFERLLRVLS
jgi:hypothetical protein